MPFGCLALGSAPLSAGTHSTSSAHVAQAQGLLAVSQLYRASF